MKMRANTTMVSKAAIAASRKYKDTYIWYFRQGANECFVIGGTSGDATQRAGFHSMRGIERRMYFNGKKL